MSLRIHAIPFVLAVFCCACATGEVEHGAKDLLDQTPPPDVPVEEVADTGEEIDLQDLPQPDVAPDQSDAPDEGEVAEVVEVDVLPDEGPDSADVVDVPEVLPTSSLGRQCGATSECHPGLPSWPSCANLQCDGQPCLLLFDYTGFCTHSCTSTAECAVVDDDPVVGRNFVCVRGGSSSRCMPGSNQACSADSACPLGESCKIGYAATAVGLELSSTCQTSYRGGAGPGGQCNDDPRRGLVTPCSNNMCLGTRCTSFCELGGNCGHAMFTCRGDVELTSGFTRNLCLGIECSSTASCTAEGYYCAPPLLMGTTANPYVASYCMLGSLADDAAALGDACGQDEDCASNWCLDYTDTAAQCSALCRLDSACATNQKCAAEILRDSQDQTFPVPMCLPAAGSKQFCTGDTVCTGGEVCRVFLVGYPQSENPSFFVGTVQTLCAQPLSPTGVGLGQSCDGGVACKSEFCITADGGASFFCSAPCVNNNDCPGTMTCSTGTLTLYDQGDSDPGNDLGVRVCLR